MTEETPSLLFSHEIGLVARVFARSSVGKRWHAPLLFADQEEALQNRSEVLTLLLSLSASWAFREKADLKEQAAGCKNEPEGQG